MAKLPIPNEVSKIWSEWQLRCCIIFSLFLQAFLVCFAPLRQRSRSTLLLFLVWSAYLLADWVAAAAIGLIIQSQTDLCESNNASDDLFAFWASFLLLHLGGPNSITSFALEDNELWLRHLFGLVLQVWGAAYSLYITLPDNKLLLPTLIVYVVGTVKYGERTRALYLGSSDRFGVSSLPEPEPGPDYEEAAGAEAEAEAEVVTTTNNEPIPVADDHQGSTLSGDSDGTKMLTIANKLYESFIKGFFVGLVPSPECQGSSRSTFLSLDDDHIGAFRIMEYELSFLYENLHTKVVMACGRLGYILGLISFCFIVSSCMIFAFSVDKHEFDKFDTGVTYALLFGAIVLDFLSFVELISSDWNLALVAQRKISNLIWRVCYSINNTRRRWSSSGCWVLQYDIISYCLDERPRWVYRLADYFHAKEIADKIKIALFSSSAKADEDVKEFIFKRMKRDSERRPVPASSKDKSAFYKDGVYTDQFLNNPLNNLDTNPSIFSAQIMIRFVNEKLAKDLLSQHLATEIYCNTVVERSRDHDQGTNERNDDDAAIRGKKTLKFFSNYVFYLMVRQQRKVCQSLDYIWEEVLQDTCDEIKRFCEENKITNHREAVEKMKEKFSSGYSLEELKGARANARSDSNKSGASKSVFQEACITANILILSDHNLNSLMSELWNFLLQASMSCRPIVLAQQLSKDGEFLTFIPLLAAHLGLSLHDL
ncbi:uncharacterized protein LOC133831405 [Humulus lupulus]|uniref:uncharacterized protein LOC133831405 n=1 Tax=Humulus lupulus TaxID=3486 RepID=UPI002B40242A|nr:uncharacterized protein LOC133831405 [Humulus lupulus]